MQGTIRTYSRAVALVALLPLFQVDRTEAQSTARLLVDENFRREPQGEVLGRLTSGSPVTVVNRQGNWLEVDIEGWMWERSMQARSQGSFDLVVSTPEGENLRIAPAGQLSGRLVQGTLLEQTGREPGWLAVRRRGWIWSASVEEDVEQGDETGAAQQTPSSLPAAIPGGFVTVQPSSPVVLTAPDGDTLAVATPGSDVEVVSREGNWARVRVEGWMWMPAVDQAVGDPGEPGEAITPDELEQSGDLHVGRVVSWRMQFISLERAEAVRTDFFEGEPFLLTRFGGSEGPFVYVALPTDRLDDFDGLIPLEFLQVTGRVRKAASSLTGTPIVDLLAFERARRQQ